MNSERKPLPVTLLSGFLGAGKTTLLNHLLSHATDTRFAVVENEFGAINIDSQLIASNTDGIVELTNGCVCCTVSDDLVRELMSLRTRREAGELNFDWIVIETTGLADPGAVAQTFFTSDDLRQHFMLDGIVVVIDAVHGNQQLDQHLVAQRQAGFADRLLLSKCDLTSQAEVVQLSERLQQINARASLQQLEHGRTDIGTLLGIGGFNLDTSLLAPETPVTQNTIRLIPRGTRPAEPAHGHAITSLLLEEGELDLDRIGAFVQDLIDQHGANLLRYKGILAIAGEPRKLIFQGVQRIAGFDFGEPWGPDEVRRSRIVVIGTDLPESVLRDGLHATRPD